MTETTGPRVGAGIDALPGWQHAFCREVRQLVHAADPRVTETIERTNPPLLRPGGLHSSTTGASSPAPRGSSPAAMPVSKTGRTVAIRYGEAVTAPALIALFRQIIANDRVGGWRELKRQADPR